ncbi:LysR family transcriptional regulator [Serratia sp. M24T3]|uniref:LysR family transcriptional regulator n=1 Tax=Serratia sp. M24T3 TaxID=932213 RepID=UPI00025B9F3D|nr:LysR family transcriptional regulator [Serratia sp. M24T3]EIC85213.1 LysR family transcriptional regulator [Serratia sp. M24T3]
MKRIIPQKLNLEQLATFELVVLHGSFSAAAEQLGLTQPAVSLQIRQLEKFFNLKLLERIAKKMKPTSAGFTLLEHNILINNAIDEALQSMAVHAHEISGQVTLGTGATACIHLLPPLLGHLKQQWPELDVNVKIGNTDEMLKAVTENRLDLALVTLPAAGNNLSITPVYEESFVVIQQAQPRLLLDEITPERLVNLPLILFENGSSTRQLIDDWFQRQGLRPHPIMELGSVEAIKQMVMAGLGVSIVPQLAMSQPQNSSRLCSHPLNPPLNRQLAVVLRQDKPLNKALKKVVDGLLALGAPSMLPAISKTD